MAKKEKPGSNLSAFFAGRLLKRKKKEQEAKLKAASLITKNKKQND